MEVCKIGTKHTSCCRSPGVLFLPILVRSILPKWHISHPTEQEYCFCHFGVFDMSKWVENGFQNAVLVCERTWRYIRG